MPTGAAVDGPTFQILGPLEVEVAGVPVDAGPPKQRAVLALLLLRANRVVSVDAIIDQLWGDEAPPKALGSLQAYVSNLRRILEPERSARGQASVLVTKAPGYLLRVEGLDLFAFEELAANGKQALEAGQPDQADRDLRAALGLWRGELLAEFADESFVLAERSRLAELRAAAEEDRAQALLDLGRHAGAVSELERLAAAEPYRERRWEQLITALYRSDRQADALRAYQTARQTLADELGIDPGPSLRRLETAVLNHDPSLDWQPVVAAPSPAVGRVPSRAAGTEAVSGRLDEDQDLVGRRAELADLEARVGRPGVILVAGEAGIGKTRLLEALAARAAAATGCTVVWGRCPEAEGAPPLWPWTRVLQQLGRPDLADPPADERSSFQLFTAVASELIDASRSRPLLVLLDDLHWADASSLGLLGVVADHLRGHDLTVVGTYRDTEAPPALRETLAALARTTGHHRVTLAGLDTDDVIELAERTAGATVDQPAAERLRARTDGNPFFLTELIKLRTSERRQSDAAIPDVVADVIRSRLARLPDDTRALLTVAAVAGREFELRVIQHAADLEEDYLLDLVDSAIATGLLIEGGSRVRFCHALVRETLYQDLVGLRRARLHRRVAEALEAQPNGADRYLDELAHHYRAALAADAGPGTGRAALDYTCRAAARAAATAAHAEAVRSWQAALALLDDEPGEPDAHRRVEVLYGLAESERLLPDAPASRMHYREAAALAADAGDLERATDAAVAGGNAVAWNWVGYTTDEEYVVLLDRLIAEVGDRDSRQRSLLLSTLAMENTARAHQPLTTASEEALALARGRGDAATLFAALHASFAASQGSPDAAGRLALANEMVGLSPLSPAAQATARLARIQARLENGDLAIEDDLAEAARLAAEHGQPSIASYVAWNRSLLALARGPIDAAELAVERSRQENVLMDDAAYYQAQLFVLRSLQGRLSELEALLPLLVESDIPGLRETAAVILASIGRSDEARAALVDEGKGLRRLALDYTFLVTACGRANAIAVIGAVDLAAEARAELEPYAGQFAVLNASVCLGAVDVYLGLLAATEGDRESAITHLRNGIARNDRAGARTWADLGRAQLDALLAGT